MMPRRYDDDVPNPVSSPNAFNKYLVDNNEVVEEYVNWVVIVNSYIPNQLVIFCKRAVDNMYDLEYVFNTESAKQQCYLEFAKIETRYSDYKIYRNARKDQSISNRLHFHIILNSNEPRTN